MAPPAESCADELGNDVRISGAFGAMGDKAPGYFAAKAILDYDLLHGASAELKD